MEPTKTVVRQVTPDQKLLLLADHWRAHAKELLLRAETMNDADARQRMLEVGARRLIPLSQVTPFRFFPLPGRLATSTESQRRGRPSWVAKDLTHPQRPSNRLRDPLWPSPESTG